MAQQRNLQDLADNLDLVHHLSDYELDRLRYLAQATIEYNNDRELINALNDLGFTVAAAATSGGVSVAISAVGTFHSIIIASDSEVRLTQNRAAEILIDTAGWVLTARRNGVIIGAGDDSDAASFWNGDIDDDGRNPEYTVLDRIRDGGLQECFGPGTPIDMWPLDSELEPGPEGIHDQDAVRAGIWTKPIERIRAGDLVVSFDHSGNLVPGPVTRTFRNEAKIVLNFHGIRVTPGHVYFRADSKKPHRFETLIDILRDDGAIQRQDGTLIRAATNVPVGSPRDGFVRAVAGPRRADGSVAARDEGRIRLGTRLVVDGRRSYAVADLIQAGGGIVGDDELIRVGNGAPVPFHWDAGDRLPAPEDFVLACSGTTLAQIYQAADWESQRPHMPAPAAPDGSPVHPLSGAALAAMPRNEPLTMDDDSSTDACGGTRKPG